jgi:hypothetical protein
MTREVQSSKGGAILHWNNVDPDSAGNGGYNTVGQQTRGGRRANAALSGAVSAGATSVTTSTPLDKAWAAGDYVHIGTGTNGEMAYVLSVTGGTTLNLDRSLIGGQAAGDPVYAVPHAFEAQNPLYLMWYGLNDVMASGTGSGGTFVSQGAGTGGAQVRVGERAFKEAYRAALAKVLTAEFFDANHASTVRSGPASQAAAAGAMLGNFARDMSVNGNVISIDVPANFAGGDLYAWFVSYGGAVHASNQMGQGGRVTFTLDGGAHAPDLDTRNAYYGTKWNCFVKVFRNVSAGRHVIQATAADIIANQYFAGWGIGAEIPPVVILPGFNRPYDYDVWPNWNYGNARGTVNANHAAGVASFTITAPLSPGGNANTLKQGELITLSKDTPNEETLEIAADATGTTVTTTTVSQFEHNTGDLYEGNVHDEAIVQRLLDWIPDVLAEGWPDSCLYVDIETALNKQERYFVQTNTVALKDGAHFSDLGHAVVAEAILGKLRESAAVAENLAAHLSVPIAPLPDPVYFLGPLATAAAGTAPGGANLVAEAFANTRQRRDLRRSVEARLQLLITSNALSTRRGRVEYSLDGGTTWKTLGKKPTWADTAIQTAGEAGQVDLNPINSLRDSGWFALPSEVWSVTDVLLRYVHGNSSAANPAYQFIALEFR